MPGVPTLPALGILFNFCLACTLDMTSWIYYGVFTVFGLLLYFSYSLSHSHLEAQTVMDGALETYRPSSETPLVSMNASPDTPFVADEFNL